MTTKLPILKADELIGALEKAGFLIIRQKGSHVRMKHPDRRAVTVPVHPGRDVGRGLLRKVLRDDELAREEFVALLERSGIRGPGLIALWLHVVNCESGGFTSMNRRR